ncbi:hypothetical protein AB0J83_14200 [Actinoplanes sp. NPDC049596]|uniref:hypothetical protein n=1 Tax=unclassified Actinoplanes TaxID=2626549 RepID=UPI0034268D08
MRFGGGFEAEGSSGLGVRPAGVNPNRAPIEVPVTGADGPQAGQFNRAPVDGPAAGPINRAPAAAQGAGGRPNRPPLEAPNMGQVNKPLGGGDEGSA